MDRRQFLVGVLATGAATVGAAALSGSPAMAANAAGKTKTQASAAQFLLGSARRALA
jgi:hypothetical protein